MLPMNTLKAHYSSIEEAIEAEKILRVARWYKKLERAKTAVVYCEEMLLKGDISSTLELFLSPHD